VHAICLSLPNNYIYSLLNSSDIIIYHFLPLTPCTCRVHPTGSANHLMSDKIMNLCRMSQEEWIKLRESVPYVKIHQYNPKHLCPKLKGYRDNGQRKVWSSLGFHALYLPADSLVHARPSVTPYLNCIPSG
jgi:hypothetical protein